MSSALCPREPTGLLCLSSDEAYSYYGARLITLFDYFLLFFIIISVFIQTMRLIGGAAARRRGSGFASYLQSLFYRRILDKLDMVCRYYSTFLIIL